MEKINTTSPKAEYHRWTADDVNELLDLLIQQLNGYPGNFEKPTARKFYCRLKERSERLRQLDPMTIKSKVRHLRVAYTSAAALESTKNGLITLDDCPSLRAMRLKSCPHFGKLKIIFGASHNLNAPAALEFSQHSEESAPQERDISDHVNSMDELDDQWLELEDGEFLWEKNRANVEQEEYHRWHFDEVNELLDLVIRNLDGNPKNFERPTARKFYCRIQEESERLRHSHFVALKSKMRHLKRGYMTAIDMENDTKGGLTTLNDSGSLQSTRLKLCPHFEKLDVIFGHCRNVNEEDEIGFIPLSEEDELQEENIAEYFNSTDDVSDRRSEMEDSHSWSSDEINELLDLVIRELNDYPDNFEKPTARKFYCQLKERSERLHQFDTMALREKIWCLRADYITAVNNEKNFKDDPNLESCPYFEKLEEIFGAGREVNELGTPEILRLPEEYALHEDEIVDCSTYTDKIAERRLRLEERKLAWQEKRASDELAFKEKNAKDVLAYKAKNAKDKLEFKRYRLEKMLEYKERIAQIKYETKYAMKYGSQ